MIIFKGSNFLFLYCETAPLFRWPSTVIETANVKNGR